MRTLYNPFNGIYRARIPSFPTKNQAVMPHAPEYRCASNPLREVTQCVSGVDKGPPPPLKGPY